MEKLKQIIEIQGGDPAIKSEDIVTGENCEDILAPAGGYVVAFSINAWWSWPAWQERRRIRRQGVTIHKKMGRG